MKNLREKEKKERKKSRGTYVVRERNSPGTKSTGLIPRGKAGLKFKTKTNFVLNIQNKNLPYLVQPTHLCKHKREMARTRRGELLIFVFFKMAPQNRE